MRFRNLLLLVMTAIVAGCAHVPQASVTLSEELGQMIVSAKASHQALVHAYIDERRLQVDEFVDSVWVPAFVSDLQARTDIVQLVNTAPSDAEKGQLLREFSEDAAVSIAQHRVALQRLLDATERILDSAVTAHYDNMLMVNGSLTAHLRSAAKVTQTRDELLKALHTQPEQILPLDRIDQKLTAIVHFKGKVDDITGKAAEIHALLDSLSHQEP